MNTFFLHSVTLTAALLLALPPGWCSGWMRHGEAATPEAAVTCCRHGGRQHSPSESRDVPAQPDRECCCSPDATVPQKSVAPADDAIGVLPLALNDAAVEADGRPFDAATPGPAGSTSPLHILQCVWRC